MVEKRVNGVPVIDSLLYPTASRRSPKVRKAGLLRLAEERLIEATIREARGELTMAWTFFWLAVELEERACRL
ncbi:hypothetical protein KKG36_00205 [Patescibacteria group bacterium]|nr:hypothetical protein [Patescibacteria group bacterium]